MSIEESNSATNVRIRLAWKNAWSNKRFRVITISGIALLITIFVCFPFFFRYIEQREGTLINDRVLGWLTPYDVSIPTFIIIWSMTILLWVRFVQDPSVFIVFLCCFVLFCLSRMVTILMLPLEPPQGLIPLEDPISSLVYGGKNLFITKDLFYSGHTSTQILMFLVLKRKTDKVLALISSIIVGILVLVQHVHYTIDVAAAIVFSYIIYRLGKKIAGQG